MLRNISSRMPALSAFLLMFLVACGGAATSTTAQGGGDSASTAPDDGGGDSSGGECVWTLDEVSSAIGVTVANSLFIEQEGGQSSCTYTDDQGIPLATYGIVTSSAPIAPQAGFDAVSEGSQPVSGVGDQAQWAEVSAGMGTLYVLSDGNLYMVTVIAGDLEAQAKQDAAINLARMLIDRA